MMRGIAQRFPRFSAATLARSLGLALGLALAFALTACGSQDESGSGNQDGEILRSDRAPALYELTDRNDQTRGWLFGTIHSLPEETVWRTEKLNAIIDEADLLVLEIADLDDAAAMFETFTQMATTPDQPDIGTRVPVERRPALFALIAEAEYRPRDFADVETWAAALLLAQAGADRNKGPGADKIILREFSARNPRANIEELEGAARQLGIFDQLPEKEQADLLIGVLDEEEMRRDDPDRLQRAWLSGDVSALERATTQGLLADPELREALLVARNREWTTSLIRILNRGDRPLIAVGAAHLVGPDGLPRMLEQNGFTVKRIQ